MHWASKYVGIPFVPGGRTPAGLDCWGLLWLAYRDFGIDIPPYPGLSPETAFKIYSDFKDPERAIWHRVEDPFDGCGVAMSQLDAIHHVGIYAATDGGKIVHCPKDATVVAQSASILRLTGYKTILFYRHSAWPTS